ncbi:MAG: HD-GYP domain-containing protein [Treponema sp.]|nr:HD-GYP domain-containing protein [Treponema sp.]
MTPVQISELTDGQRFSNNLVLDRQFVILDQEIPFSRVLQKTLLEWDFKTAYLDEPVSQTQNNSLPKNQKSSPIGEFEQVDFDLETGELVVSKKQGLGSETLDKVSAANKEILSADENRKMEIVQNVYDDYLQYITKVFTRYVTHKELSASDLSSAMKKLVEFVRQNKKYILKIQPKSEQKVNKNFLVSHCLRSTIFSIIIGIQLRFSDQKLIDLAVAASIHEIGQIRLPPQLYITSKPLSMQARALLSTHTVLGFNILKENNFPPTIQLGVLEHHERENGGGYPRRLTGDKISVFGKILAVACTYEAISAPRQYKEAKSIYEAMIEMLRNLNKAYDENVVKALVQAISLFPIGSYVYLSNGKIAQVADANPNDPRTPLVQIVGEKNELGNPKTVMTDNDKLRIVRVVNQAELKDILAYLK